MGKTLGDFLGEALRKRADEEFRFLGVPNRTIKALRENKVSVNQLMGWYFAGGRKEIFQHVHRLPGIGDTGANKLAGCIVISVRLGFIEVQRGTSFRVNLPE